MAILGYNTAGPSTTPLNSGDKGLSKWTLASAQTMTELHGSFTSGSGGSIILCIYADVAGVPTSRLAYTNPLSLGSGGNIELSQAGFSVALAAGDYWLGYTCGSTFGSIYLDTVGGTSDRWAGGTAFNPPATPCEGGTTPGARRYSVWAVVGAAGPSLLLSKSGDGTVPPENYNAVVDAVYGKNSLLSTLVLKAGSGSVDGRKYNALIDAVYVLSPSLALLNLKSGDGSIDGRKFNALIDIVNVLP